MTDTRLVTGGVRNAVGDRVACDQVTIIGDGTTESPLRSGSSGDSEVLFSNPLSDPNEPRVGNPVVAIAGDAEGLDGVVRTGSAGTGSPQLPQVVGVLVEAPDAGSSGVPVRMRTTGKVTLTTDEWDLITGDSGGLTEGAPYYLDWGFNSFGHLTTVAPTGSGQKKVQVGVALNVTTLVLSLPALPIPIP